MKRLLLALFALCVVVVPLAAQEKTTLTLVTHDSFNVTESVLDAFQKETGITFRNDFQKAKTRGGIIKVSARGTCLL